MRISFHRKNRAEQVCCRHLQISIEEYKKTAEQIAQKVLLEWDQVAVLWLIAAIQNSTRRQEAFMLQGKPPYAKTQTVLIPRQLQPEVARKLQQWLHNRETEQLKVSVERLIEEQIRKLTSENQSRMQNIIPLNQWIRREA